MAYDPLIDDYHDNKRYYLPPLERAFSCYNHFDRNEVLYRLDKDVQHYIVNEITHNIRQLLPQIKVEIKEELRLELLKEVANQKAGANLDF